MLDHRLLDFQLVHGELVQHPVGHRLPHLTDESGKLVEVLSLEIVSGLSRHGVGMHVLLLVEVLASFPAQQPLAQRHAVTQELFLLLQQACVLLLFGYLLVEVGAVDKFLLLVEVGFERGERGGGLLLDFLGCLYGPVIGIGLGASAAFFFQPVPAGVTPPFVAEHFRYIFFHLL